MFLRGHDLADAMDLPQPRIRRGGERFQFPLDRLEVLAQSHVLAGEHPHRGLGRGGDVEVLAQLQSPKS